jgi:hypothetical protein
LLRGDRLLAVGRDGPTGPYYLALVVNGSVHARATWHSGQDKSLEVSESLGLIAHQPLKWRHLAQRPPVSG